MAIETIVKIAQIFAYFVAGISFIVAFFTYRTNNKIKRGEWLKSLFEKFYEAKIFSKVRAEIEYGRIETYLNIFADGTVLNEEHEEQLVDYLNFFEFVATLQKNGHLKFTEVNQLFGYYLKAIKCNNFLKEYLTKYDFEILIALLNKYE